MLEVCPYFGTLYCCLESVIELVLCYRLEVIWCHSEEVEHIKWTNKGSEGTLYISESRVHEISRALGYNSVLVCPTEVIKLWTTSNWCFQISDGNEAVSCPHIACVCIVSRWC